MKHLKEKLESPVCLFLKSHLWVRDDLYNNTIRRDLVYNQSKILSYHRQSLCIMLVGRHNLSSFLAGGATENIMIPPAPGEIEILGYFGGFMGYLRGK